MLRTNSFDDCLAFDSQKQFHPLKYIIALAQEFISLGGNILENTYINNVETKDGICTAVGECSKFKALNLVYATHIPPGINLFSFRCAPYRSYVLGIKLSNETDYPDCMAYDMEEPYHYIRTHKVDGEKLLIIGGEDYKTGQLEHEKPFIDLEAYANKYFSIKAVPYR